MSANFSKLGTRGRRVGIKNETILALAEFGKLLFKNLGLLLVTLINKTDFDYFKTEIGSNSY